MAPKIILMAVGSGRMEEQQRLERLRSASPSQLRQELSTRVAERFEDRYTSCRLTAVLRALMRSRALPYRELPLLAVKHYSERTQCRFHWSQAPL